MTTSPQGGRTSGIHNLVAAFCIVGVIFTNLYGQSTQALPVLGDRVERPVKSTPVLQPKDTKAIDCLAKNLYYEARGEGEKGMEAVALVTLNRTNDPNFPDSVCGVVYQARTRDGVPLKYQCQFTWYCDGVPDRIRDQYSWGKAYQVAFKVYVGHKLNTLVDFTYGATYYHTHAVKPRWSRQFTRTAIIGNHIFYRG